MTRALLLALLLATAGFAADDPPFPYPDRAFTVGEFLRLVARALDLNFVVRDSVPKTRRLEATFRNMSCRQALDLVLALEELQMVEFRPGLYVITRASDRFDGGALTQRRFVLTHTTAARVIAAIRANPRLAAQVDVARLSAGGDERTLIAMGSPASHAALTDALGSLDAPSGRAPVVLPLSFIGREELDAALGAMGPAALGGLRREEIAYLPNRRGVAVNGTPEQVDRLRTLIAQLDVAPESVTLGVASANRVAERARTQGLDTAGNVRYERTASASAQDGVLWLTTLSGEPARIAIEQVFNVALAPGLASEVPVGLALEVLPRVQGRAVLVTVSLVDSSPNRISDAGVDRSQRSLLTTALVPRGGSISIGGLATALRDSGRTDLLASRRSRLSDLSLTLFVR